jgi:two-component system phosphate regulon sensor histidine kinase PhoR
MKLSFQNRVLAGCLLVVLATLLLVGVVMESFLASRVSQNIGQAMESQLVLLRELVADRWRAEAPLASSEHLAQDLGDKLGMRVTLVALDGRVLGDSDLQIKQVEELENHASRPEVAQALAQGRGSSVRWSSTLQVDLLYAATLLGEVAQPRLVIRLAMPLAALQESLAASRRLVAAALALGVLISLGVAYLVARGVTHPVKALTATAQEITAGNLSTRVRRYAPGEIGELGRAFDGMAQALQDRLDDLAREAGRQEAILRGMVEGVLLTDGQGLVLLVNQAFMDIFGLSADPTGRPYYEVARNPDLQEAMGRVMGGDKRLTRELRVLSPRERFVEAHLVGVRGAGEQDGVVAVFHDVSERRRTEQMRRDFVANTSHELRTPLAAIKAAAETLLDGALDNPEHARNFVQMIARQSTRLEGLGDDLLSLARLESGRVELEREALSLSGLMESALLLAKDQAGRKGTPLEARPLDQEAFILGDRRQLEQALTNLLDNAIKYGEPGRPVILEFTVRGQEAWLAVRDQGPGIAAEHLPRLCERFYRVDKDRSRRQGGTGLGLAIVKHIAQAHGGRVDASSEPGRGSTFTIRLPGE